MTKISIFNHKVPKRFEEKLANFETCGAPSKTRELFGKTPRVIFRNALFWETAGQGGEGKGCLAQARRHVREHTLAHYAHTASSRFLCSPFTLFFNLLIYKMIQVKKEPFFSFTGWRKLFNSLHPYYFEYQWVLRSRWRSEGKKRKKPTRA